MKTLLKSNLLLISIFILANVDCGYTERGHANTPPAYPGSQPMAGPDTMAHPGNIDKDTIHVE